MQLRYKYRVEPTPSQRTALARAFGCARVVFNDALRARENAYQAGLPYPSDAELMRQVITQAKTTPERAWLGEVSAVVLQQAVGDLNTAYRNFFASVTGRRKGRRVARPRFRSRKDNRQAVRFTANARFWVLEGGRVRLPKIGDLRVRWSRPLPAAPSSVTIIKEAAGRYFASFVVRVARAHARVADTRRDFHHKLSTTLIRDNQAVYVEDLAVSGLARARLAKSVHDAGWSAFVSMLEYKAARHGRTFTRVDRWFPSTRTCSDCGALGEKLPLNVRSWSCRCGSVHDRDVNAARNLLAAGRADNSNDRGAHVRPSSRTALRNEAVIHPDAAWSTRNVEGIPALLARGERQCDHR